MNVRSNMIQGLVLIPFLVLISCSSQPTKVAHVAPARTVFTILHASNRQGTLEPCGCEKNPFGGIDREKNAVERFRSEGNALFYVDAGNTFLDAKANKPTSRHHKDKAKNIIGMLNTIGLDALSPGPIDYTMGLDSLKELAQSSQFPFVSTNVVDSSGNTPFSPYALIEKKGLIIAFVSATPSVPENSGASVKSLESVLPQTIQELRKKSDVVVLLSQMGMEQDDTLAKSLDVDIIIGSDPSHSSDTPFVLEKGKTLLVDTSNYGYRLGKLDIDLRLPFAGFSSSKAIAENLSLIKVAEKYAAAKPKDLKRQEYVASLKRKSLVTPIAGGSDFQHQMIPLDQKHFGQPNEVSKLMQQSKKQIRLRSLSE